MKKKVTLTKEYVSGLKQRIEHLEQELRNCKADRDIFRGYFVDTLKFALQCLGKNQSINSEWFAKDLSKLMNRVEQWYWG